MGSLRCQKCALKEQVDSAVILAVAEFHLLFPEKKLPRLKYLTGAIKLFPKKA